MCRILAYLGEPLPVRNLLFDTDNSLGSDKINEAGGGVDTLDFSPTTTRAIKVNLGIATAYERYYGVLKRLGSSPLPRSGLVIAKILVILLGHWTLQRHRRTSCKKARKQCQNRTFPSEKWR